MYSVNRKSAHRSVNLCKLIARLGLKKFEEICENCKIRSNWKYVLFSISSLFSNLQSLNIPYSRENKPCLFKTHEVFGRAYFRAMLIFKTWLCKISMNFSKYILYFGWFQCIQTFLCLNYTFWAYCYALISTFIPKKYVIYVSTAFFSAEGL